jgi:hypothetical protein
MLRMKLLKNVGTLNKTTNRAGLEDLAQLVATGLRIRASRLVVSPSLATVLIVNYLSPARHSKHLNQQRIYKSPIKSWGPGHIHSEGRSTRGRRYYRKLSMAAIDQGKVG